MPPVIEHRTQLVLYPSSLISISCFPIKKVSISGGAPLTLCNAAGPFGASWGPDDTIIFAPTAQSGLFQVSAAGGTPQELTTQAGEFSHRWPEFLPDGKAVLFTVGTGQGWENQETVVQSLETGERRALIPGATYARYVPTGHLVYIQAHRSVQPNGELFFSALGITMTGDRLGRN